MLLYYYFKLLLISNISNIYIQQKHITQQLRICITNQFRNREAQQTVQRLFDERQFDPAFRL